MNVRNVLKVVITCAKFFEITHARTRFALYSQTKIYSVELGRKPNFHLDLWSSAAACLFSGGAQVTKRLRNSMFAIMSSVMALLVQPANSLSELAVISPAKPGLQNVKKVSLQAQKNSTANANMAKKTANKNPAKANVSTAKTMPVKGTIASKRTKSIANKKQSSSAQKLAARRLPKRIIAKKVVPAKPMPLAQRKLINDSFANGYADKYTPRDMVRAGAFSYFPLRGGVFKRRSPIKAVVVHSTETASPASAKDIVRSWNNSGPNHAGTQFIVDRDGIIYLTVTDPSIGTFHVNSFITKEGVKNDNSIGIEIVRTGKQTYTKPQLASVSRLVHYLLDRYQIPEVWGHGEIQPTDRTDPVGFNWTSFDNDLDGLELSQSKYKAEQIRIAAIKKQEQAKLAAAKKLQTPEAALLAAVKKQISTEKESNPIAADRKLQEAANQNRLNSDKKQTSEKAPGRIVADGKHVTEKG